MEQCPEEKANFFSRMFYTWLNPTLKEAARSPITTEAIYRRPEIEGSDYVTGKLEQHWEQEKRKPRPSLHRAVYRAQLKYMVYTAITILTEVLSLNQKSVVNSSAGHIINLLSTDAQRFELTFMFLHYAWVGPLQALVVFYLMGEITLVPTICGAAVMAVFIPMQSLMNRAYSKL
ncbi:hypothetical protein T265_14260, partial [Opisthorchis viverrini]